MSLCFPYLLGLSFPMPKGKRQSITFGELTDKLVSVRGTVVKASTVRPLVVEMSFESESAKKELGVYFLIPPSIGNLKGCKSKIFNPLRCTARAIDFQKIR